MLYAGGSTGDRSDSYETAVIDTIVAEVQSVPGEDRCMLLLGHKGQIIEMFQVKNAYPAIHLIADLSFSLERMLTQAYHDVL